MRNWIAAALILVLGLSLTACGNDNAGTTANRWNDAAQQQANARGPIGDQSDGTYHADERGGQKRHHPEGPERRQNRQRAGKLTSATAKNRGGLRHLCFYSTSQSHRVYDGSVLCVHGIPSKKRSYRNGDGLTRPAGSPGRSSRWRYPPGRARCSRSAGS